MVVLSLFDGISCGQLALNNARIPYQKYYASEIDAHAIKVTQHNFPETIQLGDVKNLKCNELPKIDLLIGGSPCQGFSMSGKKLNFNDPRSKLFFEFVRLVEECKPHYWFLENVVMKKDYENIITETLKVNPVKINSALVSAQNRERLYWANFPITIPLDKKINLIDILEDTEMFRPSGIRGRKLDREGKRHDNDENFKLIQCLEVKKHNTNKSNCLTTVGKDNVLTNLPIGRYVDVYSNNLPYRYYTTKEYCRLQTIPEDYFSIIKNDNEIKKMIGNAWTIDVITHIFQDMVNNNKEQSKIIFKNKQTQ